MIKLYIHIITIGTIILFSSCSNSNKDYQELTDPRDGQTYKISVLRDSNTWTIRNINYNHLDSTKVGLSVWGKGQVYTWEEAQKVCPPRWHLPNIIEWTYLAESYGGYHDAMDQNYITGNPTKSFKSLKKIFAKGGEFWSSSDRSFGTYHLKHNFAFTFLLNSKHQTTAFFYQHKDQKRPCMCLKNQEEENTLNIEK